MDHAVQTTISKNSSTSSKEQISMKMPQTMAEQ